MQHLQYRRVLLLSEEYPPEVGGIQNFLSQLIAQLPHGDVVVVTKNNNGAEKWDKEQKYKIVRVSMRNFSWPRWRRAYMETRKQVLNFKPELILCGKGLFEGRAALKIKKEFGIPYVVVTYGMEISSWVSHWKTKKDLRKVIREAARVIVINEQTKKILMTLLEEKDSEKFVKMYPGVDEKFDNSIEKFDAREIGIVSVCRLVHRKGIDVVIKAMPEIIKAFPNAIYRIIGDGPERKNLENLVNKLKLQNNVHFLGKISDEEIIKNFKISDLFVLTPRNESGNIEGFGIVYIEAALAGLASVGSKSGGVPEAVLDGKTGLLANEDDTQDTAKKIIELLKNSELRFKLARQARARAKEDFIWSKRVILFRGIVESVVVDKKNGGT